MEEEIDVLGNIEDFEAFVTILFLIWFGLDQRKKRRENVKNFYKIFVKTLFNLDFRQREMAREMV